MNMVKMQLPMRSMSNLTPPIRMGRGRGCEFKIHWLYACHSPIKIIWSKCSFFFSCDRVLKGGM